LALSDYSSTFLVALAKNKISHIDQIKPMDEHYCAPLLSYSLTA
jgi:hypothetical protein